MRLLFITRKFPPSVGGMQRLSFELAAELSKHTPTTVIAWGRSQRQLPYFLPYAFFKAAYLIQRGKVDHVHLGDGLLAPMGFLLKCLFRKSTTCTVAGLDITFKSRLYQLVVPRCLARLDKITCISNATMRECLQRGVPKHKCTVIPIGVHADTFQIEARREDLEGMVGRVLGNRLVIVTAGRLVKRKGVSWFIENVVPVLTPDLLYLVVGDGPERTRIEQIIESLRLQDRVMLLGKVSDHDLKVIYNTADMFIMPNIPVAGDIEGFGIVALEAASAGLPVIASDLEGIRDAVLDGQTGCLVTPQSVSAFEVAIKKHVGIGAQGRQGIRQAVERSYSWPAIGARYMVALRSAHDQVATT